MVHFLGISGLVCGMIEFTSPLRVREKQAASRGPVEMFEHWFSVSDPSLDM